jgi:hypothetical protein
MGRPVRVAMAAAMALRIMKARRSEPSGGSVQSSSGAMAPFSDVVTAASSQALLAGGAASRQSVGPTRLAAPSAAWREL